MNKNLFLIILAGFKPPTTGDQRATYQVEKWPFRQPAISNIQTIGFQGAFRCIVKCQIWTICTFNLSPVELIIGLAPVGIGSWAAANGEVGTGQSQAMHWDHFIEFVKTHLHKIKSINARGIHILAVLKG